jgi:hypothetical protein
MFSNETGRMPFSLSGKYRLTLASNVSYGSLNKLIKFRLGEAGSVARILSYWKTIGRRR